MSYCTASGVKVYLNSSRINVDDWPIDADIEDLIEFNDGIIDKMCDGTYTTASGVEYYDLFRGDKLITRHIPIISITEIAELQDDETYLALTASRDEDLEDSYYIKDENVGLIILNDPSYDKNAYRITYTWGYSSTPRWIQKLSLLMTARDVLNRIASSCDSHDLKNEYMRHIRTIDVEIDKLETLVETDYRIWTRVF